MKLIVRIPDPAEVSLTLYGITSKRLPNGSVVDVAHTDKGKFVFMTDNWRRLPDRHTVHASDYSYSAACGCWACHEGVGL